MIDIQVQYIFNILIFVFTYIYINIQFKNKKKMYGYLFNNYLYLRDTNNKKRTLLPLKKPYHPHATLTPITIVTSHHVRIKQTYVHPHV